MGRLVLGFNGQRQRFDGAKVQSRHLLGVVLFTLQAAQVEAKGAIDDVDDRQKQQRGLPSDPAIQGAEQSGERRTDQVVGK